MELLIQDPVLGLGAVMLIGFAGGRVAAMVKLPALTGYIIAGLALGPNVLGAIPQQVLDSLRDPVSSIAVSIIAFMLGGDLTIRTIRSLGAKLIKFSIFDSIWTYALVAIGLIAIASQSPAVALPLAALAASPAPTVVVPIVKELRARGPFTSALLMTSALEDITCVILISISIAIVAPMLAGGAFSVGAVWLGLVEIGGSVAFGAVMGFALRTALLRLRGTAELLLSATTILLATGLSAAMGLSSLISVLTIGFVVLNYGRHTAELFRSIDTLSTPIMLVFFTLAGASLQPALIPQAGLAVVVYILARIVAKLTGTRAYAKHVGLEPNVYREMPKCLLSQAGTTLGLTMIVAQHLPQVSDEILTVMISAVIFFELIAPPWTKNIIVKLGEAGGNSEKGSQIEATSA